MMILIFWCRRQWSKILMIPSVSWSSNFGSLIFKGQQISSGLTSSHILTAHAIIYFWRIVIGHHMRSADSLCLLDYRDQDVYVRTWNVYSACGKVTYMLPCTLYPLLRTSWQWNTYKIHQFGMTACPCTLPQFIKNVVSFQTYGDSLMELLERFVAWADIRKNVTHGFANVMQ